MIPRYLLSLCHRAFMGSLKVLANLNLGVSQSTKSRAASCHCFTPCPCFASCDCCHDPFIVRSAQTRPTFTGFTQLCTSVSMFNDQRSQLPVSVFTLGLQPRHQIHHRLVTFILYWSVGSMVSRNTNPANLQCCCSAEAETGFVPTSAQFFAVSTFLLLSAPS